MEEIKKELLSENKEILWNKSQIANRLEDHIIFTRCIFLFLLLFFIFFEIGSFFSGNFEWFWSDVIVFTLVGGFVIGMLIRTKIRETQIFKKKGEDPYNYEVGLLITSQDWYVKDYLNFKTGEGVTLRENKKDIAIIKTNDIDLIKVHEHVQRKKNSIFFIYLAQADTNRFNLLTSLRIKLSNSEYEDLINILKKLIPFEEVKHKGKIFDLWSKFYRKKEYSKIYEDFGDEYPSAYGF